MMVTEESTVADEPVGIDPVNTALPPKGTLAESTVRVTVPTLAWDCLSFSKPPVTISVVSRTAAKAMRQ